MSSSLPAVLVPPRSEDIRIEPKSASDAVRQSSRVVRMRIAIVDKSSLTRECVVTALTNSSENRRRHDDFDILPFWSLNDLTANETPVDVVVYYLHRSSRALDPRISDVAGLAPVIIIAEDNEPELVRKAFELGVRGYMPIESTGIDLLLHTVRMVKAGGTFVPLSVLSHSEPRPSEADRLTERETLVLDLLILGKPNKIIAYQLGMSESTVKVHIRNILEKTKTKNRTQAVAHALSLRSQEPAKAER